ncbi:tail fiber protein [Paenibacillus sp. E222]|uniref:tail fiber protein n=1 Tax=Paenibacillus sp. E222 TaxID=2748863 RepID=UPI0015C68226|nr:tail fiber protein [Paenibacillus sp. E222]QLG42297.1 tail fiber protein [Paenibacillus sp. E222]
MPKETDRLKLPLPLGNENVTRESINGVFEKIDAGVATKAELDTLREAVSKMDIPDASLTQKGKVQLSSKTDGTSETVAATEKAVRDASVAAISVATTDATTKANAAVASIISLDSSNLVQNSSANLGFYGWSDYGSAPWSVTAGTNFRTLKYFQVTGAVAANSYAVLDSNVINVIAGTYNLQAMFYTLGMTTGVLFIEVKNASDDITINSLVADSNSNWHRKSKTVTIPSGVTSVKLRLVVAGGASGVPGSVKAISRIKFSAGAVDVPYTAEADDLALFEKGQAELRWGSINDASEATIFFKGTSPSNNTTNKVVYTVPTAKKIVIKSIVICNPQTIDVTFSIKIGNVWFAYEHAIKTNDTIIFPVADQVLHEGRTIELSGTGPSLNYRISGELMNNTTLYKSDVSRAGMATSSTAFYPTGTRVILKSIAFCNPTANEAAITVLVGGVHIISGKKIKPYDTVIVPFANVIKESNEGISGLSTVAGVTYHLNAEVI